MKKPSTYSAAAAILLLTLAAHAQAPTTQPATTAADWNKTLAPYIDDDTFAIAHADMSKFDAPAITNYLLDIMDSVKVPADDPMRKDLAAGMLVAGDFVSKFTRFGGHDVFAVWDHNDAMSLSTPAFLIPIGPKGNAAAMTELLKGTFGKRDLYPGLPVAALSENLLVMAQDATLKRVQSIKPSPRPNLQFTGGRPDLFASIVVSPTADERRALSELLPALPADFGGASIQWLTRDIDNLSLEITLPPKPHANLTFVNHVGMITINGGSLTIDGVPQPDPVAYFFKSFRESKAFKNSLQDKAIGPSASELRTLLTDILTPQQNSLSISDTQFRSLETIMLRDQMNALYESRNAQSQANIKGLLVTCITYASKHNDQWPASLDVLVKDKQVSEEQLKNPRDPEQRPYAYQPLPGAASLPLPLIWEQTDDPAASRNVGYADGHVELRTPQEFQDDMHRLADFKAAHAAPAR